MNHYRRQLLLPATPAAVYLAPTTQQGLRNWWTETCEIAAAIGARSTFRFGPHHKVISLVETGRGAPFIAKPVTSV